MNNGISKIDEFIVSQKPECSLLLQILPLNWRDRLVTNSHNYRQYSGLGTREVKKKKKRENVKAFLLF